MANIPVTSGIDEIITELIGETKGRQQLLTFRNGSLKELEEAALISRNRELPFTEKTEALAYYRSSHSPNEIVYVTEKIAEVSDSVLERIFFGKPIWAHFRLPFRLAMLCFIRQHERFHYLFERASIIVERSQSMSCYEDYRDQVYVFRDEKNVGNLEEALAEAYGYVSFDAGASELGLKRMVNELLWSDTAYEALVKIAKNAFLSCSRPPGYREGILFIQEFEKLLQHQNPLKSTAADTESKGLSWLYDELVNQNPHNPKDYNTSPNVIPSDTAAFTQFIQSFRYEHSQWEQILPHPIERSSQRKASFTCQFTPPVTIYTIPSRHLILILEEIQQTMQSIVKQQADFSTQILAVIEGQTRKIKDFIRKSKPPRKPPRKKKQKPKSKGTDKKA